MAISHLTIAAFCLPVVAFISSAILTLWVRCWAEGTGFVSRPREDRYNRNVIALGGGIAIFWSITLLLFLIILAVPVLMYPLPWKTESIQLYLEGFTAKGGDLLIVMACAFILHLTGLWDDKKHLGPFVKLGIQFVAAFIAAWFADIRVEMFIENKLITTALSVFWIVLMINALNFLDNMDGASVGIAL